MLNLILVACIVVSFAVYFYFKTRQFRSALPIRKKWYKAKSNVALGIFLAFFGLNTTIIYPTIVGYIVAAIFFIFGLLFANTNLKIARHEGKYILEEYELNQ